MLNRRTFSLAAGSMLAAPKAFARNTPPKVFTWIGDSAAAMYWDDPANWAEKEYPNQAESIAVFSSTISQNSTILLRHDVRVARFWFDSEKYSYTFSPAAGVLDPSTGEEPKIVMDTIAEYTSTTVDSNNKVDHNFSAMITHSCHWGFPDRYAQIGDHVTTINFNRPMYNYRDSRRASLQVNGRLIFQLNSENSFKGPAVAFNGGEISVKTKGAIPDGTPIYLAEGGKLSISSGVLVKASKFVIDDKVLPNGVYHADGMPPAMNAFQQAEIAAATKLVTDGQLHPVTGISGPGLIVVG